MKVKRHNLKGFEAETNEASSELFKSTKTKHPNIYIISQNLSNNQKLESENPRS